VLESISFFLGAKNSKHCSNEKGPSSTPCHSGGNDRFCARLKTDISAFSSGLQGHMRSCFTILDSSRRPLSKNVRHDLVRPRRPELEADMSVFNLAQKRSFPPLCMPEIVQRNNSERSSATSQCIWIQIFLTRHIYFIFIWDVKDKFFVNCDLKHGTSIWMV
jgi:hypothetical protein